MSAADVGVACPLFVVKDVPTTLAFYRDRLGFEITFQGPEPQDIFFGMVGRGLAMFMFKSIGVEPVPNHTRDIKQGIAPWDAYVHTPDPDALHAELQARNVQFFKPLMNNQDGLRGFEVQDPNGYVLYFGTPHESARREFGLTDKTA
ncbi:MAG TPA: VOC family protein [Vicinamibacterales bacterium]|nr:VOC family protein [Vicinamibacterales bacterium]